MACKFICDGCGKEENAFFNGKDFVKPKLWHSRQDDEGIQIACCKGCIEKISKETGKTNIIAPF